MLRSSLSRVPLIVPPAACLFTGGSRKQERRDCKGIKILLGMSLQPEERGPLTLTGGLLGSETGPRGLSAVPVSSTMGVPLRWVSSPFASSAGALLSWAPAVLGLFHAEVVSARLHPSHGTLDVTRVYVPRFFVSSQQRFGVTDIKALSACHSS